MNRRLYQLCHEYVKCYEVLSCLMAVDGIDGERLKLFRLMQERTENLESEMETCIVEGDLMNGDG